MSIHVFALLCVLPLDAPVSGEGCAWDNDVRTNAFSARAMSPPNFPDIRVVDDFEVFDNECRISSVHIATIEDAGWSDGGQITVSIYADTGGEGPGEEIVSVERAYTKLDSGGQYFGRDFFQYWIEDVNIDLVAGKYWLGVRNERGVGSGTNYWLTSDGGEDGRESDTGWFSLNGGETFMPEGANWHHAFEINMNSRVGACCGDNGGCTDGVFEPRCRDRYAPGMTCADLEPGFCTGACCHPDGTCDDQVSRNGCGEDRFAQGISCDELEEPCAATCLVAPGKKLASRDGAERSEFGASVAISGRTMVVGMDRAVGATGVKAAHVYTLRGDGPAWRNRLRPLSQTEEDAFGSAVAISGDPARVIVVGAFADDLAGHNAGAVYAYRKGELDRQWDREAVLRADDIAEGDLFGRAVAASGDVIVVGARSDDLGDRSGSVYVFRFEANQWQQEQKLLAPDGGEGDWFGRWVDVEDSLIVVGSPGDDDGGSNSGAVYTYRFDRGRWVFEDKLGADDAAPGASFGTVALSGDTLIVGALWDDDNGNASGSAYVFRYDGAKWHQEAKLLPENGMADARFGSSVSIDGTTAVIGAFNDSNYGERRGLVYVFQRGEDGAWGETAQLMPTGRGIWGYFGQSVGVSGSMVVVGSPRDDFGYDNSGAAYVYRAVSTDCNDNGVADACDIAQRRSFDRDLNGLPDECEGVCCVGDTCIETILDECEGFGCVRDPAWVCDGDVDGDGQVNPVDAGLVQAAFGSTRERDLCRYDLDCDGRINPTDVGIVQSLFGACNDPRSACGGGTWTEGVDCGNFQCP